MRNGKKSTNNVLPCWHHATSINGLLITPCYYIILQAYNTMHSLAIKQSQYNCSVLTLIIFAPGNSSDTQKRVTRLHPRPKLIKLSTPFLQSHSWLSSCLHCLQMKSHERQLRGYAVSHRGIHCCNNTFALRCSYLTLTMNYQPAIFFIYIQVLYIGMPSWPWAASSSSNWIEIETEC